MGDIISGIFGSKPSVSTFTPTPVNTLDPAQMQAEQELIAALRGTGGTPQSVFPSYGGQLAAPASPLQTTSLDALQNLVTGSGRAGAGASGVQSADLATLTKIMQGQPTDLNSYYNTNVLQPLQHTFETTTLPAIMSALGGSQGGPRSTAAVSGVTDASNNFMNTLAATQGDLALKTGQLNTTNQLTAASQTPAAAASPLTALINELTAGAVPQQLSQTALTLPYQQFQYNQQQTQTALTDLINLLAAKTTTTTQPVVSPGQPGLLGGLLGNAGLGSSFGNFLFGGGGGGGLQANTDYTNTLAGLY